MVACAYAAAADAMLMRRPMRVKRMRFSGSYNGARFNLSAAVLFGKPAVKIVPCAIGCGQSAVRTVISHFLGGIRKITAVGVKGYIVFGFRPAGVERVRFFCRNGGVCVHLSAAVLFGIPTVKMIAGTNWRGHFAVGTIMLYGLCLFARVQRTAVGIKRNCDFIAGVDKIQIIIFAILLYLQPPIIRVIAEDALVVWLRPRLRINLQRIQKNRRAVLGDAGEVDAYLCVSACVYAGSKYNLRVRIAEIEVVLGRIDRVVIDIRSNRASVSIYVAHVYYLCRRKRLQIEAAARFGGGVAGDAAVPVTDEADADIRAAAPLGRVTGYGAAVKLAASVCVAIKAAAVNSAAIPCGGVVDNLAAVEMKMCSACGIDTTAVGSAVIGNDTAVDIDRAGIPRVVRRNTAAVAGGRVAGNRTAIHRKAAIASRD